MRLAKTDNELIRDFHHVWHPCTQMKDHEEVPPLLVDRAEGIYLFDRDGNRYMDVISSWWVNLLGHNHPRLNDAVKAQLDRMAHVMFAGITHRPAIDLAEKLVRLTPPNLTRVFFSDNGSTSVEIALKMSVQYWMQSGKPGKKRFAYLSGGYHGETLGALSVCGIGMFRKPFEEVLAPNIEVAGPDCFRCPYGLKPESCAAECFEPMEKTLESRHRELAAVIVEPLVQGAAGMKMYPAAYLAKLQDACRAHGVHTIYDEIAVGFGRTGDLFVCSGKKMDPTFLCLSKGITSGYLPLAVTMTGEEVFSAFYGDYESLKLFIHSHSYTANPLACACANATLDILTGENFMAGLAPRISAMREEARRLEDLEWCGEYRQTGMIGALELVRDRATGEPFPFDRRIGYRVYLEGLKRGIFMRPLGNVIYFLPPLVISPEEIGTMVETARQCVEAVLNP
ncbi:MAG: adenosylmethionine--8-amino-7-oxononanoate transaminase [Nitrospinae bacterium CG11_big_fil_rev_8_21_14_0_20_56_8]|nr:MAG: adenosylmethionine--8-amino-7-oxononanoate transaminase [Nitrospinae bacterium CG11_big_fil_rev_8_21_14_0_20_56_8]